MTDPQPNIMHLLIPGSLKKYDEIMWYIMYKQIIEIFQEWHNAVTFNSPLMTKNKRSVASM